MDQNDYPLDLSLPKKPYKLCNDSLVLPMANKNDSLDLRSALAASNEIACPTEESALAPISNLDDDMDDNCSINSEISLYAPSLS